MTYVKTVLVFITHYICYVDQKEQTPNTFTFCAEKQNNARCSLVDG